MRVLAFIAIFIFIIMCGIYIKITYDKGMHIFTGLCIALEVVCVSVLGYFIWLLAKGK